MDPGHSCPEKENSFKTNNKWNHYTGKKSSEKKMSPNKVISQKKKDETENIENMDIYVNLKRRRDSEDLVTEGEEKTSKENYNATTRDRSTIPATAAGKKKKN